MLSKSLLILLKITAIDVAWTEKLVIGKSTTDLYSRVEKIDAAVWTMLMISAAALCSSLFNASSVPAPAVLSTSPPLSARNIQISYDGLQPPLVTTPGIGPWMHAWQLFFDSIRPPLLSLSTKTVTKDAGTFKFNWEARLEEAWIEPPSPYSHIISPRHTLPSTSLKSSELITDCRIYL